MERCGNCKKDISGVFRRNRTCLICNKKFCSKCFTLCQVNYKRGSTKGYCCTCYIKSNPENMDYPKYTFEAIPRRESYSQDISKHINPINLDPLQELKNLGLLGEGSTSQVFKVSNRIKHIYALKVLKRSTEKNFIEEEFIKSYLSDCDNIVGCYALYYYRHQHSILFEFMDMSLLKFNTYFTQKEENIIAYIMRETLKGLEYLHSRFTIHRDIKCENLFVNTKGEIKIGDLGFNAQLFRERDIRETVAGSPMWAAPEVLTGQKYGLSCDIWSLGMSCIELVEGDARFSDCKSQLELQIKIVHEPEPRLSSPWSESLQEFIVFCMQKNPSQRKSASFLLQSQFIQSVNESAAIQSIKKIVNSNL